MNVNNLRDLYIEQLKDLHSAKTQAADAYARWRDASSEDMLVSLFDNHLEDIKEHQATIESICDGLGVDPSGHTCHGMKGLVREGDEFLNDVSDDDARDAGLIAMAQRVEHYNMAGFGCARTYALHLDHGEAAEHLQAILEEEAANDERMTEIAQERLNLEAVA